MVTIMKKLINKLAGFIFNLIGLPYYVAKEIIKWTVVGINKLIDVIKLIIKVLVDGAGGKEEGARALLTCREATGKTSLHFAAAMGRKETCAYILEIFSLLRIYVEKLYFNGLIYFIFKQKNFKYLCIISFFCYMYVIYVFRTRFSNSTTRRSSKK